MAQPFPPQGNQTMAVEKPVRRWAEQFAPPAPLPIGAIDTVVPPVYVNGEPRVEIPGNGTVRLQPGDWVISSRYSGHVVEVISDEEYQERFGSGGPPQAGVQPV